ncbi:MAG TPA: molybdenum-pterin-binding protein [Myxococcales bacterium]|jgi:molybdopterin-binding protein|nr:molybdenum-pterin-binding protein [Myxococcales bacterium]
MELSARNQLKGTVKNVSTDNIMAEVTVDFGGQEVVSVITKSSFERLGIKAGQPVTVIIKATDVMLAR